MAGLLIGLIVVEVVLQRHGGPPFASLPAPDENRAPWGPVVLVGLVLAAYALALVERLALAFAPGTAALLLVLLAVWLALRTVTLRHRRGDPFEFAGAGHREVHFDLGQTS